ncbi:PREDICTED: neuroblast differentiation-associated protein AHNAK-like [Poecilia mexicana]|uniref:neuroblast differentiation-associated protein AHNAK-like n=1 Tax=Poecilia mexicana TaxID=48701 RepID=UPI00072DF26C|nr:PREDICTED: neuroblast differentiation-associated protein AHNAK-like [Poecilia mexicana]
MAKHRRGRSLSEALTLEESENGALVISSATDSSHNLKEGDEILGATIDFNQLSKQEVINVLKLMEPFDDKVKVLTRSCLSRSVDNLDQCARNPEAMLMDSYTKLYNAKIKRFVKDDSSAAGKAASSKVNLKRDMGLPRLGVDFGLLKSTSLSADADADSKFQVRDLTDGTNLNLPPLGGSLNGPTAGNTLVSRPRLDGRNPQSHLGDYHLSQALPDDLNGITAAGDLKMPNLEKVLDTGLASKGSDVFLPDHDIEVMGPDGISTVPKGKLSLKHAKRLKTPDLNLDDPSGFMESPKLRLSGTLPQMDLGKVNVDTPSGSVQLPNMECPGGSLGADKTIDFNVKTPKIKSGMSASDANLSKVDLKGINLATDTPSASVKSPTGKYKAPKFTMPKFDLPHIQVPDLDVDISGPSGKFKKPNVNMPDLSLSGPKIGGPNLDLGSPDLDASTPKLRSDFKTPKLDVSGPKTDLDMPSGTIKMPEIEGPDWDVKGPSGKLKMPKMDLSGTLPKGPNLDLNADLKSPDWSLKTPKIKGGINAPDLELPDMDLKAPKLDINTPDVNIGSPKGKLKMPKMKMPKFSFPGIKGPELDGNLNGPDIDVNAPDLNLKAPKADLDLNMPDLSGKFKKPNLKMPDLGLSGPKIDGPNLDMPSGKVKMPDIEGPDWDVKGPSGKIKMPKMNLSGTLPKGPNLDLNADLKSPDWSLKTPKIKGGINAPDLELPDMDLKAPKLDINTPDVNIGSPKGKLKMPKFKMPKFSFPGIKGPKLDGNLNGPDIDVNAPDLNLKAPKADLDLNMPDLSGKFKKPNLTMPDLGLSGPKIDGPNLDLGSPDLDVSGPNLRGGINMPDINMPKANFKTPKLDLSGPKANLDMPSGKLNVPKIEGPDWDAKGPSGKLKMPKMNLSGSSPNLDLNADLKSPDFSVKAPKVKGGMKGFEMPDVGFGSPSVNHKKYNLKMPKVGFSGSKLSGSDLDIPKIKGGLDSPNPSLPNKDFRTSIPDFDVPDVEFGTAPLKLKNLKIPDVGFSSPKLEDPKLDFTSPDFNAKLPKGQNLKLTSDLNSPELDFRSPNFNAKLPKGQNVKLNPDLNSPELNLRAPNMKGGVNSSKLGAPNVNLQAPKLDINTPDGNIGLPGANVKKSQMKMPKGLNANLTSDLNMPNLSGNSPKISGRKLRDSDFSLPALDLAEYGINGPKLNAKQRNMRVNGNIGQPDMNFSDPRMKGDLIGARMGMNSSLIDIRSPHLRSPDLNIDNASINFKGVSYKNRRSDMAGMSLKRPDLDIDQDIRLNKKYTKTNVRSSYPTVDQGLHQNIDFNRSDLNIDDFTGRDHVLRARGSQPDLRAQSNHPQWIPSSGVYVDPRNSRRLPDGSRDHSMDGLPQNNLDSSGGYFVTVFPKKALQKSKYNTTSGLGFPTAKMDLDVPDENYLKGSTYFFSNLV